jgi:hypothetical protein
MPHPGMKQRRSHEDEARFIPEENYLALMVHAIFF